MKEQLLLFFGESLDLRPQFICHVQSDIHYAQSSGHSRTLGVHMIRSAAYIRVSTEKQAEEDKVSLGAY